MRKRCYLNFRIKDEKKGGAIPANYTDFFQYYPIMSEFSEKEGLLFGVAFSKNVPVVLENTQVLEVNEIDLPNLNDNLRKGIYKLWDFESIGVIGFTCRGYYKKTEGDKREKVEGCVGCKHNKPNELMPKPRLIVEK